MTKNKKQHTIWSNLNLETKDWEEGYRENLEMNGFSDDEIAEKLTDENILDFAIETNNMYFDDERANGYKEIYYSDLYKAIISRIALLQNVSMQSGM